MRRYRTSIHALLAVALLGTVVTGCGADQVDNFNVTIEDEAEVPGASAVDLVLGMFPQLDGFTRFDISQSQTFQNQDHSPDDVDSVVLESLTLAVVAPDGQDLSFLGSVDVVIESEGLPPQLIARQEEFPEGATEVSFDTLNRDIKDYVLAQEGTATINVMDSQRPERATTIRVVAVFDVDVDVL